MTSTSFDLRATGEYLKLGYKIVKCPVCGKETLDLMQMTDPFYHE